MDFNHVDPQPKLIFRQILDELTDEDYDDEFDDLDSKS